MSLKPKLKHKIMSSNILKIIIFDKSFLIRQALAALTESLVRSELIDEYHDISRFKISVETCKPHIVFVNNELLDGFPEDSMQEIKQECKFILIGITYNNKLAGHKTVDEYLHINDDKESLSRIINRQINHIFPKKEKKVNDKLISEREKDIITLVAKGMTNKEIAAQLYISIHTVITHRKNISRKLGINSVSGITVYAILNKLIEMKDLY